MMTATWGPTQAKETVEKFVKLADAPDITWQRTRRYGHAQGRPYSIRFVFNRHDGEPSWRSNITIYAQHPMSIIGDAFGPDKVIDPPAWLIELIEQATPTDRPTEEVNQLRERIEKAHEALAIEEFDQESCPDLESTIEYAVRGYRVLARAEADAADRVQELRIQLDRALNGGAA